MTAFFVYLSIVVAGVAVCIDWAKAFRDLYYDGLRPMLTRVTCPIMRLYRAYTSTYEGRHRAGNVRQPTDSEVDRWRGADDSFADFLHTLNLEVHMNDQARA